MSLNVEVLEQSFERVKPQADDFAFSFYQNLLTDYPQLRPLFAKTNMEQQQQKLMMSLVLVVENLRNPSYLKVILKNLGERHVSYGAIESHYPMVGAALLKTFESYLGSDWTLEVKQAWTDAYGLLVKMMLEGAKKPETISQSENAIGLNYKQVESGKAPNQAPTNTSSVNYSQGTSNLDITQPDNIKLVDSKFPTYPNEKNSHITSKWVNSSQSSEIEPNVKQDESGKPPTQIATTSSLNLKLLLIISVIAGLLGVGFFYIHYSNLKHDNGSLKSSAAKATSEDEQLAFC